MPNHPHAPYGLRDLDGLEKAFWFLNQNRSTHCFSVPAEIEGLSTVEPLLAAANSLGKQLPFVSARIVVDMKVVEVRGRHWTQYLEHELSDAFDAMMD